jgi:predicted MFS family arabinose efflux permease
MKLASAPDPAVETEVRQSPLGRLFRAFTYRDFRLLWFGAFTSSAGTWMQQAAQSWLILLLTNDPAWLGLNEFLATAPILFLSLVGGVVADRTDRRRILLTSQYLQLCFAFTLAALAWFDVVSVWHILLLSLLTGVAQAFGGPAYQALIPTLVERRDLANALALNSIQFNLARMVGPVMAGEALALFGAAACFGLNGLSFMAVIIALSFVRVRFIPQTGNGRNMRSEMRLGLAFVWHQPALRSLTLLAFALAFLGFQVVTFLSFFAREVFHMEVKGFSHLLAMSGAGAVTGALVVAWLGDAPHKGRIALRMQIVLGLIITAFAFTTKIWLAYVLVYLCGVFMMTSFGPIASLVQLLVNDEMRGRVMSIYNTAFRGGMPLGSLITGVLLKHFSPTQVFATEGLLMMIIALYFLTASSQAEVRK